MIVWSGMGFLVALITIGCMLGMQKFVGSHFHDANYYEAHGWPKLVSFLIAGVIVGIVGRWINYREADMSPDPDTASKSSFFFIPMQYWGPILAALGVVFLFVEK
jgi:hypothetical protein